MVGDFSQTIYFRKVLNNVELSSNMNVKKIGMSESRDIGKNCVYSFICKPYHFFINWTLSLLGPDGTFASSSLQKFEKTNKQSEIFKYRRTNEGNYRGNPKLKFPDDDSPEKC